MALRLFALPSWWAACAVLMVRDHLADPFDPRLEGTARYGHNPAGALTVWLALSLVELVVVGLFIRPWSYDRSWPRAVVALLLVAPWTVLNGILTMHGGGISVLHLLWLVGLVIGLVVCAMWSALSKLRVTAARA